MWGNSMQNDDMHSAGSCMASGQPPDDALILRIAQGDTAALEVLYRQTSSSIYGFALSILRDPVAAEDVMQDTFVSVMQSAPGYQPSGKPMAWLLTIARNLALMRLRRAESKNLSFDELFHVEDTHDAYQTTENHMVLEKVLHTLTDGERQIVMLHCPDSSTEKLPTCWVSRRQPLFHAITARWQSCAIRWEVTILTDKELLERLRAEVAAVTPDCWSGILARVQSPAQQPEEAPVVPMPERKRRSAWRGWVAAAAVFFLVILGGGLYATQVPGGVATLDANPSIELTVNKLGRVLSARACNPDAQFVLDGLELRNQSLQTAADAIVANMQANGYVSADANSILVTVEAGKGDARLCGRLADAVESAQTDCGMESAVLAQVLEDDPALEAYASAVGVSAGKAMLIRQISAQVQDLTGSELVGLPINDLNILAASNQVELSGIESIGAASTGVYVPYDKALQAALTCCGLTTDDVTRASMRFTLIDGEMVMEFVLSDGERHYVCSVDAETTEVCRLTGDEPKRPEEAEIVPVSPVVRPNSPVTPAPTPTPTPMPAPAPAPTPTPPVGPVTQEQALKIAIAAAGISESDLAAWDVQLDESGVQPVYRVTLTTVYYFHPRYVVAVDQQTGTVLSVERSA